MESSLPALVLAPEELAGVIEALHDGILRRLRWSTYKSLEYTKWRQLELETVQIVIDGFVAAYTKAVMLYREQEFKYNKFEDQFIFGDEVWDLLADITTAKTWDEVPFHPVHAPKDCVVCATIFGNTE